MNDKEINKFKKLAKQLLIEEGYGACDIQLYANQGINFKHRATDEEIEQRINFFVEKNNLINKR
jgi:hypothetical protein